MMAKKPIHTVPTDKGWANKQNGETLSNHKTKETAERAGRSEAKKNETEHVIHNKNGRISEKNSYGNDPCPPKDKK